MRSRKLLMEAARAKQKEDSVRDDRWERLHSEGSSGSSHRGAREVADDLYSDPLSISRRGFGNDSEGH